MARLFVAGRTGTGHPGVGPRGGTSEAGSDPFRPDFSDLLTEKWSAFEFGPAESGLFIVAADGIDVAPATALVDLGDLDPSYRLTGRTLNLLANRLGVDRQDVAGKTVGEALFLTHEQKGGQPFRSSRDRGGRRVRQYRIRLNDHILFEQDAVAGGAVDITDAFTYSNGVLDGNADWSGISGEFSAYVRSNQLAVEFTSEDEENRHVDALSSSDHYTQADLDINTANTTTSTWLWTRRPNSDAKTGYRFHYQTYGGGYNLRRLTAGSSTVLASGGSGAVSAGIYEVRGESDGSDHELFVDDSSTLTATDSNHTGTYCGIGLYLEGSTTRATWDNFEAGTLSSSFTGSGTPTQAAQTSSGTGAYTPPDITGSGTPSQDAQTASGTGTYTPPSVTGSGTPSQASQTSSGSGTFTTPVFTGSGTPAQDAQTSSGTGTHTPPPITGSGTPTQDGQTSSGTGTFSSGVTGSGSPSQDAQTASGSGAYTPGPVTGSGTPTQAADTASGSGTFIPLITGSGSPTQEDQTSSGSGTRTSGSEVTGSGAVTQAAQTCTASGTFTAPVFTGSGAVAQEDQYTNWSLETPTTTWLSTKTRHRTDTERPGRDLLVSGSWLARRTRR